MPIFHIVSLFPEFFESPFSTGLLGRAFKCGMLEASFHNPRDFSQERHRHVDDSPYGGGPGMVMQAPPLTDALRSINKPGRILLMSASGRQFDQQFAGELAREENITLICGRYEGIDARINQLFPVEEVSLCPAVLNGGEACAAAIIEAVSRLLPGFMGKAESAEEESFSHGLLEYPQYTRPEIYEDLKVPAVLLGGNHAEIARWRHGQALAKTLRLRPEMLDAAPLTARDAAYLREMPMHRVGRNLSFCLCHYPVYLDKRTIGASSLTNLDIHDIARISRSYGMSDFYVLSPLKDQLDLLRSILSHWLNGPGSEKNKDRSRALQSVKAVENFEEARKLAKRKHGMEPVFLGTSANWPKNGQTLTPADARTLCAAAPVIICLGTAKGLALEHMDFCKGVLRPIRFIGDNHLSVRSAAAILADRILGDFH